MDMTASQIQPDLTAARERWVARGVAAPAIVAMLERAGAEDKKILVYPQMLHEVLREVEREEVFGEILAWMKARI